MVLEMEWSLWTYWLDYYNFFNSSIWYSMCSLYALSLCPCPIILSLELRTMPSSSSHLQHCLLEKRVMPTCELKHMWWKTSCINILTEPYTKHKSSFFASLIVLKEIDSLLGNTKYFSLNMTGRKAVIWKFFLILCVPNL